MDKARKLKTVDEAGIIIDNFKNNCALFQINSCFKNFPGLRCICLIYTLCIISMEKARMYKICIIIRSGV